MSPNNYKQLLIGSIILSSIIFFSNHLSSYAQKLPERTDDSSETLDIIIPPPILSGQEQGRYQESRNPVIQREMVEIVQQENQEEEKGIEILEQQEDIEQKLEEELEEDDISITASSSNIIEEEVEEGQDNDQGNNDIPLGLPFP
jgi:hypothetical protein